MEEPVRQVARILATQHASAPAEPGDWPPGQPGCAAGSAGKTTSRRSGSCPRIWSTPRSSTRPSTWRTGSSLSRDPLFAARAQAGRIVDGHGDLLADDIFCLDDGPRILDCLDFDDRLRWVDGLDDAAFLAMDLERLGAPELAEQFTGWYAEYSGDPAPTSLRHHYAAYRSLVRAKVDFLRAMPR